MPQLKITDPRVVSHQSELLQPFFVTRVTKLVAPCVRSSGSENERNVFPSAAASVIVDEAQTSARESCDHDGGYLLRTFSPPAISTMKELSNVPWLHL